MWHQSSILANIQYGCVRADMWKNAFSFPKLFLLEQDTVGEGELDDTQVIEDGIRFVYLEFHTSFMDAGWP